MGYPGPLGKADGVNAEPGNWFIRKAAVLRAWWPAAQDTTVVW